MTKNKRLFSGTPADPFQTERFSDFFTSYHQRFVLFSYSYVRDMSVAEDLVMESMLKIWEQRLHEDTQINLASYVFSALRNKALNFLRDEKTRLRVHSYLAEHQEKELLLRISTLQACDPELIFSKDLEKIIRKAMNAIPEKSRKIFELTRQGSFTQPEIADKLGVSVKTIEFHVSKALRVLKLHLQDHIPFYWIIVLFR